MTKTLDSTQKKRLRAAAHTLKPVVMIGNHGYTEAVGLAIDEALNTHELIKVRLRGIAQEDRKEISQQICEQYHAQEIDMIGAIVILFRKNPEKQASKPPGRSPGRAPGKSAGKPFARSRGN